MKIHKNLTKKFKHTLIWGLFVKHNPQKVDEGHVVGDEVVIQAVKK